MGERENGGEGVDLELSLEDVGVHGVLSRSLRVIARLQEDESSGALCTVVCVRIRMACFVKVESVGIRVNQDGFHLAIQNTTNQCTKLRVLTGKSQIRNNLARWKHEKAIT